MIKNYYTILELTESSTIEDIRKSYRKLAKQYHPDVNKASDATERFIEITEAYEFLTTVKANASTTTTNEWKNEEYYNNSEYEEFKQKVRESAQKQAKMRYDVFKNQNEAFQKSGFNDISLILLIIIRIIAFPLVFILIISPFYIAFNFDIRVLSLLLLTLPLAALVIWLMYDSRKKYFLPRPFYYSFARIKTIFTETHESNESCYYCPNKVANSKPYSIELLRLKDVKLKMEGYRQHKVNYQNDTIQVAIPRSHKALIVHTLCSICKILSIIGCLVFLDVSSVVWRFVIGIWLGIIISTLILLFSKTKSNVSFLIDMSLITRMLIWLFFIVILSTFYFSPFNIFTSDFIQACMVSIIFLDCFLMQFIGLIVGKYASIPIFKQYSEVELYIKKGYKSYNDIPILSVIYPFYKWLFG